MSEPVSKSLLDIQEELEKLFPRTFLDTEKVQFQELKSMDFPKDLLAVYAKRNPNRILEFGRFRYFPIDELIDENIWSSPGETLYQLGFSIIGATSDDELLCLNMNDKNSLGQRDVLAFPRDFACEPDDHKSARKHMKFVSNSLIELMARELAFHRKSLKKVE
jgi:hypothetical protein